MDKLVVPRRGRGFGQRFQQEVVQLILLLHLQSRLGEGVCATIYVGSRLVGATILYSSRWHLISYVYPPQAATAREPLAGGKGYLLSHDSRMCRHTMIMRRHHSRMHLSTTPAKDSSSNEYNPVPHVFARQSLASQSSCFQTSTRESSFDSLRTIVTSLSHSTTSNLYFTGRINRDLYNLLSTLPKLSVEHIRDIRPPQGHTRPPQVHIKDTSRTTKSTSRTTSSTARTYSSTSGPHQGHIKDNQVHIKDNIVQLKDNQVHIKDNPVHIKDTSRTYSSTATTTSSTSRTT
ncbi:uncharacterized protein BDR25DRAFT_397586, partial [Lindgomyces ingoldianus]